MREEHRLRVLENRVLRKIFESKGDKVIGKWRKLHNGELRNLYTSPNIMWMIKSGSRGAGHMACVGRAEVQ